MKVKRVDSLMGWLRPFLGRFHQARIPAKILIHALVLFFGGFSISLIVFVFFFGKHDSVPTANGSLSSSSSDVHWLMGAGGDTVPRQAHSLTGEIIDLVDRHLVTLRVKSARADFFRQVASQLDAGVSYDRAVNSYLKQLDPYSTYIPPLADLALNHQDRIFAKGLGVLFLSWGSEILVVSAKGGPAYRSGLQDALFLRAMAGQSVVGAAIQSVVAQIDEIFSHHNEVEFLFAHPSTGKTKGLRLRQGDFIPPSLESRDMAGSGAGRFSYVRILRFVTNQTRDDLKKILWLRPKTAGALYLDLRYCQGGDLHEALDAISLFAPKGALLAITYDKQGEIQEYHGLSGVKYTTRPIYIMVGPHTASAGEVFAQGMVDTVVGVTLVGAKTYGKCVAQKKFSLTNGGWLNLSNLKIFSANNNFCQLSQQDPEIAVPAPELFDTQKIFLSMHPVHP